MCLSNFVSISHSGTMILRYLQRVNICPYQGSRTIRTEEAVLITLSRLSPYIAKNASSSSSSDNSGKSATKSKKKKVITEDIVFSDAAVSDESSEEDEE